MPETAFSNALAGCRTWPVERVAAGVSSPTTTLASIGDELGEFRLASIAKVFTAWACLVAVEEGSVALDDPLGPPGATLRHCLAHAAGFGFDGREPIARVGTRRIYSNSGIELASDHVALHTGIPFAEYLNEAVLRPLRLERTFLRGSPAHALYSCLDDVLTFTREMLSPALISQETATEACAVQFPALAGIVPGMGSYDPNPWGLGMEIHGAKQPHWMGSRTSARTCGHFGGAGTMFWVDPDAQIALVALTDRPFDEWADDARALWAMLSDAVIDERMRS